MSHVPGIQVNGEGGIRTLEGGKPAWLRGMPVSGPSRGYGPLSPLHGRKPSHVIENKGFETECWIWLGSVNSRGYGIRGTKHGGLYLVHRAIYETCRGPIPAGDHVHHRCEQKRCVNPAHLEVASALEHSRKHAPGPVPLAEAFMAALADGPLSRHELGWVAVAPGSRCRGWWRGVRRYGWGGAAMRCRNRQNF